MGGRSMFVGGLMMVACSASPPARALVEPEPPMKRVAPVKRVEPVPAQPEEQHVALNFEAVVRVAAPQRPNGKSFRGVQLERPDGELWVVTYGPEGWLQAFDGRTVLVTGGPYEPSGQALVGAKHFRIATLTVQDPQRGVGPLFGVGPVMTLVGRFVRAQGPVGSKNEGETYSTFLTTDGTSYLLEGWPEGQLEHGPAVEVVARKVEPDLSYRARRGGDYLWIIAVRKQ